MDTGPNESQEEIDQKIEGLNQIIDAKVEAAKVEAAKVEAAKVEAANRGKKTVSMPTSSKEEEKVSTTTFPKEEEKVSTPTFPKEEETVSTPTFPKEEEKVSTPNEKTKNNLTISIERSVMFDMKNNRYHDEHAWLTRVNLWKKMIDKNYSIDSNTLEKLKNYKSKCKAFNEILSYYYEKHPPVKGGTKSSTNKISKKRNKKSQKTTNKKSKSKNKTNNRKSKRRNKISKKTNRQSKKSRLKF